MQGRSSQLDILRGVAVLSVVLHHTGYLSLFHIGWAGVDLFFVISGFLISGLLFKEWKHNGQISLKRFFIRRGFKIYPAFYFFLLTTVSIIVLSGPLRHDAFRRYAAEIFFLQDYLPSVWSHTWSLAVEEQFYLLLPLLLLVISRIQGRSTAKPFAAIPTISLLLIVICLALRVAQHQPKVDDVRFAFQFRVDAMFAGVAMGYMFHFRNRAFLWMSKWWLLPLGLGALLPLRLYGDSFDMVPYVLTCNILAFSILLLWIVPRSRIRLPWVEKIGFYSYSIYLWNVPVTLCFWGYQMRFLGFVLDVLASIAAGVYMGKIIEVRALRLREKYFPEVVTAGILSSNGEQKGVVTAGA